MSETYEYMLTYTFSCSAKMIYYAWLSSEGHTAMTSAIAHVDPRVGGRFDVYDGYISGKTLELEPPHKIVQSWRTAQFTDQHEDSIIEVILDESGGQTVLTLTHKNVPIDQTSSEQGGWEKHYFQRMKQRFEWLKNMPKPGVNA